MQEWMHTIGHTDEAIDTLNIIHIAGTKGKGSTCSFVESFLRAHGQRTGFPAKTGLYTSPHLVFPEERIRINSHPLSQDLFAKYFFEIYDKLPQLKDDYNPDLSFVARGPRYLQLFALLAFHVFVREKVDVVVLETHSGGEFDSTNFIKRPVVTAVTTLGLDHVDMLGPTIEDIAWHKSGIFKESAVALSSIQDVVPKEELARRAKEKGHDIEFIGEDSRLNDSGLKPEVQRINASLALAAAEHWLKRKAPETQRNLTDEDVRLGLKQWKWPGRFEVLRRDGIAWFLDSAHNEMSVEVASRWFADSSTSLTKSVTRVLIFSHINEVRDGVRLLERLARALHDCSVGIAYLVLTTYDAVQGDTNETNLDFSPLSAVWLKFFPHSQIKIRMTISGALGFVTEIAKGQDGGMAHVLITGSQHLVGPASFILRQR